MGPYFLGEQALLRAAGRDGQGVGAVRGLVYAAARGDTVARDALRQSGDWLGIGVANLVNIFNPELAGSLTHLRLRTPALGDDAPLVGAAELAFEALLTDPLS